MARCAVALALAQLRINKGENASFCGQPHVGAHLREGLGTSTVPSKSNITPLMPVKFICSTLTLFSSFYFTVILKVRLTPT